MKSDALQELHEYLSSNGFLPTSFWSGEYDAAFYPSSKDDIGVILLRNNNRISVLGAYLTGGAAFAAPIRKGSHVASARYALLNGLPEDAFGYLKFLIEGGYVLPDNPRLILKVVSDEDVANLVAGLPVVVGAMVYQASVGYTPRTAVTAFKLCNIAIDYEGDI